MIYSIENSATEDTLTFFETPTQKEGGYPSIELKLQSKGKDILHFHTFITKKFPIRREKTGFEQEKNIKHNLIRYKTKTQCQIHRFSNPENKDFKYKIEFLTPHERFHISIHIHNRSCFIYETIV